MQSLSTSSLETLRVAALFGRSFPLSALAEVVNMPEQLMQSIIDELVQFSLLSRLGDGGESESAGDAPFFPANASTPHYQFFQGIVQEVLSGQVPAYQARALHGLIGSALEKYYGERAPAAQLARHFALGDRPESALQWSILAGEYAARQQAYREAVGHYRTALRLVEKHIVPAQGQSPSPVLLHRLIGQSWFKLGELHQALEELQLALEQANSASAPLPPLLLAQVNRMMSDIYRMQGRYDLAFSHLQAARNNITLIGKREREKALPGNDNGTTRDTVTEHIQLLQADAMLDLLLLRFEQAERALWQSNQLAAGVGDRESQAFALHLVGWIRGWGEHIHEAIRFQEQAHALYVAIGDPFHAVMGDQGLGIIYQALGEMERARLHNLRGLEQARRYGVRHALGWLYWNQGVMALAEGNWAACESYLQQVMQEVELTDNARLKPVLLQAQAELYFRKGDWQRAEPLFQASIQAAASTEWYASAMALYGHFLAVTGRRSEARAQLERAAEIPEPGAYSGHFYIPFLAEGFLHLERNEQAAAYIEQIRPLRGFMYYGVAVDRIRGEVAALAADWETAQQAFDDGLSLCRKVQNQPEEAAILYEQARMELSRSSKQRIPGVFARVSALCEQAREIFSRYDMSRAITMVDTLREGVRQLELREGEREHTDTAQVYTQAYRLHPAKEYHLDLKLTRREQEVLRLVAEGHTDREVAETLIISHRTVNRHLSNIFVKLDVPGRAAAVAFAIRQGLVG